MQIYCSDPQIIFHPYAFAQINRYKHYTTPCGKVFKSSKLSINKEHVTLNNVDDYKIINPATGETYPIFLVVPCHKCPLCLEKKSISWSTRALAEAISSDSPSYFITLTYSSKFLPADGVNKIHVQNFFKRLRRNLDKLNISHNIRYVAVSEYGSKSKRPHYHIILYNYPLQNVSLYHILTQIEKAWSIPVGGYHSDGSPITEQIGFCYVLPVTNGCTNYVMKYMSKSNNIPKGQNKTFLLSSRKNGGIGSAFINKHIDFYQNNPTTCDISLLSPYDGSVHTSLLSGYFKNKVFPNDSNILSRGFTNNYKLACNFLNLSKYIHIQYLSEKFDYPNEFLQLTKQLSNTYLYNNSFSVSKSFLHRYLPQYLNPNVYRSIAYKIYCIGLEFLNSSLMYYSNDHICKLNHIHSIKPFQRAAVSTRFINSPLPNIKDELYRIIDKKLKSINKEVI